VSDGSAMAWIVSLFIRSRSILKGPLPRLVFRQPESIRLDTPLILFKSTPIYHRAKSLLLY
jgi:hypothetical protein